MSPSGIGFFYAKINIMKNKIELDSKYNNEIKTKIEKDLETIKKTNQIMINFD